MNRSTEQRDAEVVKTLKILDDMPRLEVHHLFRAHLLQRIDAIEAKSSFAVSLSGGFNPRFAFFGLLLVFNIASGMLFFMHGTPQSTTSNSGVLAEAFNEDYGGPALSYYDQTGADRGQDDLKK
ncbi:MAG: hypothetical protein HGB22_02605 [Chlorobiaceae bacterium]|nr:hypothetical protein [Chlorobiaceae bacterium]